MLDDNPFAKAGDTAMSQTEAQRAKYASGICGNSDVRAEALELLLPDSKGDLLDHGSIFEIFDFEVGEVVNDRFQILRRVGTGGMGTVYEVEDLHLHGRKALKAIRPECVLDAEIVQRFTREAKVAQTIGHHNVCRVYDFGIARRSGQKLLFLTMEFLEGETLHSRIARKRFSAPEALELLRQIAAGLDAAHSSKIIHRDLKPANVMLVPERAATRAVITDFGVARRFSNTETLTSVTKTGEAVGTPEYSAPEQRIGEADTSADIYSLAVLAYAMVVGDPPGQLSHHKLVSALGWVAGRRWHTAICKCVDKPERRFKTGANFVTALSANIVRICAYATSLGLLLLFGAWIVHWLTVPAIIIPENPRIAVIPLQADNDPVLRHLADDLSDGLAAQLRDVARVHVISPGDAYDIADVGKSAKESARDLGANLILHGFASKLGSSIAIQFALDNVENGQRLINERWSGTIGQISNLKRTICTRVAILIAGSQNKRQINAASPPSGPAVEAILPYLQGEHALRDDDKRLDDAIRFYNEAATLDPKFARAYAGLADAFYAKYEKAASTDDAELAVQYATHAAQLDPNLLEARLSLATAYTALGETKAAIKTLQAVLGLQPNSDSAYRRLGKAYLEAGQTSKALLAYQKAVEINPFYWNNHYQLGEAYRQVLKTREALEEFTRVVGPPPGRGIGYEGMGNVYFYEGQYSKAMESYSKALKMDTHPSYTLYSNMGTVHFYLHDYPTAVELFKQALTIDDSSYLAHLNLADAYRAIADTDHANLEYNAAIRIALGLLQHQPREKEIMGNVALGYAKLGDARQSISLIHRARVIDTNDVDLIYDEAVIDSLTGRENAAKRLVRRLLANGYSMNNIKNDPDLSRIQ